MSAGINFIVVLNEAFGYLLNELNKLNMDMEDGDSIINAAVDMVFMTDADRESYLDREQYILFNNGLKPADANIYYGALHMFAMMVSATLSNNGMLNPSVRGTLLNLHRRGSVVASWNYTTSLVGYSLLIVMTEPLC